METKDAFEAMEDGVRIFIGAAALLGAGFGGMRDWRGVTLALVGNGLLVGGVAGLMEAGMVPGGLALARRMQDGGVLLMMAAGVCAVVGWARGRGDKNAKRATAGKQTQ
jgi:hypothetical protein